MTDEDDFELTVNRSMFCEYVSGVSDDDVLRQIILGNHVDPRTANSVSFFFTDD